MKSWFIQHLERLPCPTDAAIFKLWEHLRQADPLMALSWNYARRIATIWLRQKWMRAIDAAVDDLVRRSRDVPPTLTTDFDKTLTKGS